MAEIEPNGQDPFWQYVASHLEEDSGIPPSEQEVNDAIEKIQQGIKEIIGFNIDLSYIRNREIIRKNTSRWN